MYNKYIIFINLGVYTPFIFILAREFLLMVVKAKELAKMLNVSPATVSLVLNNKPGISDSLRHNIIEKIKELGYEDMLQNSNSPRKSSAKSGKSKDRQSIAYLIYTTSEENTERFAFYPAVLEGAEKEARDHSMALLVLHVNSNGGNDYLPSLLKNANAVGVIIQARNITPEIKGDIEQIDLPCVFIDSYRPTERYSAVCINNEQGVYTAVDYLQKMGHSEIGYILSGNESDSSIERRKYFHQALREYNLPDKREYYYNAGGNDSKAFTNLYEQWKAKPKMPTAFVVENDLLAWSAMKALTKNGYKIPNDISIIGFDSRSICTMTEPNLTSIKNFRHLMGQQAFFLLLNRLILKRSGVDADVPMKLELPTELVERDSVKNLNLEK